MSGAPAAHGERRRRARATAAPLATTALAALLLVLLPAPASAATSTKPKPNDPLTVSPRLGRSPDPAEARRRARSRFPGLGPVPPNKGGGGDVAPASVCGADSLAASDQRAVCNIVTSWFDTETGEWDSYDCTAFIIGPRTLATAGHCVYWKDAAFEGGGGYASSIDVYCDGADVCSGPEGDGNVAASYGTRVLTTRGYARKPNLPGPYDAAVIAVADDLVAYTRAKPIAVSAATGRRRPFAARLAGYPSRNDESPACSVDAYANACYQYASAGTLDPSTARRGASGLYTSGTLDLCRGHSGGPVFDGDTGKAVAIVSGFSNTQCLNLFTPLVSAGSANRATCERARGGGVSLDCLRRALAKRGEELGR